MTVAKFDNIMNSNDLHILVEVAMKNNVKELRKAYGWTQSMLAKEAFLSRATIGAIENESLDVVKSDTIIGLVNALRKSAHEIFPDLSCVPIDKKD